MSKRRIFISIENGLVWDAYSDGDDVELVILDNDYSTVWKKTCIHNKEKVNEFTDVPIEELTVSKLLEITGKHRKEVKRT